MVGRGRSGGASSTGSGGSDATIGSGARIGSGATIASGASIVTSIASGGRLGSLGGSVLPRPISTEGLECSRSNSWSWAWRRRRAARTTTAPITTARAIAAIVRSGIVTPRIREVGPSFMILYVIRPWRLCTLGLAACGASPGGQVSPSQASAPVPDPVPDLPVPAPLPPPEPPASSALSWQTGPQVGYGVAFKDTRSPAGENLFIGYAGYGITLASAEAWVDALDDASLAALGVRYLWAVQGPNELTYGNLEIGNSRIVTTLLPLVGPGTRFVLVAGHSSGSFVAHELLGRLAGGLDPQGITAGRVVYFNLDGGASGLTPGAVGRLRRAYFVAAHDGNTGTDSPRMETMRSLGATYASAGGYWQGEASDAGCRRGARWCVHDTLITTRPHLATRASPQLDYSDFTGRQPCHTWIDAKADEAGILP
jgi:hypothetical protein